MMNVVDRGIKEQYNEADTRKIVTMILTKYLGWDEYENLTCEQMINSRYADYVIRTSDEEIAIVEVKQIGLKLKESHLNQSRLYAIDEGIDWIILTNGNDWIVYRIILDDKKPVTRRVFSIQISDPDMKPADKANLLYLLSAEANRKKEIEDYYERKIALSGENLADHILDDPVINKLRLSIKASTGQRLENSEIAEALLAHLFAPEVITEEHRKAINRMKRQERAKRQARVQKNNAAKQDEEPQISEERLKQYARANYNSMQPAKKAKDDENLIH